tara:strand:+ start:1710 stop:2426 length:717 start_codon:yes stop_codon:yes gene_type:complete
LLRSIVPFLAALLFVSSATASQLEVGSEALALAAQQTIQSYCADAAGDDVTLAAESVALVSALWAQVSAAADAGGEPYLLYWRGLLGECLKQSEKAEEDLQRFIANAADTQALASLVRDASRRLKRLQRNAGVLSPRPAPVPPESVVLLGVGGAMAAVGFGLAAGAYAEGSQLFPGLSNLETYDANIDSYRQNWTAERVGIAIGASGVAMLTAGLVRLLVERANESSVAKARTKRRRP